MTINPRVAPVSAKASGVESAPVRPDASNGA